MTQPTATTNSPSAPRSSATTRPSSTPSTSVTKLPPWKVVLHNDAVNEMEHVVESLCRFARLSVPAATRCTMEAHKKGLSMVLATHREHAELVAEQLTSLSLCVTIEAC
jgi:ATP-dependent Clp protease adaptor protein ClpS